MLIHYTASGPYIYVSYGFKKIMENEIGEKIVFLCNNFLRDKYGIEQKIQNTLASVDTVKIFSPKKDDFSKILFIYEVMQNSGQSCDEAINRINSVLKMDRNSLDILLDQK